MVGSQAGRDPSSPGEHGWEEHQGTGSRGDSAPDTCWDRPAPNKSCAWGVGKELVRPAAGWDGSLEHQPPGDTTRKPMCKPPEG